MVNFDNETTVATPSIDVNRIQILERRKYVIDSLEVYTQHRFSGAGGNDRIFRSRLAALFWELQETLRRKLKEPKEDLLPYNEMKEIIIPNEGDKAPIEKVLEAWETINFLLGDLRLTKIDTRKNYDPIDLEKENMENSL